MTQQKSNQRTPYEKKLFWRKVRMYLMWTLTFVACLIVSLTSFNARFFEAIDPQIRSAYIQMAKLMPALDANEKALVATYESLVMGRAEARKMGFTLSKEAIADSRSARDILDGSSAVDRITRLTVGRHGFVTVASKETGKILTHPNENEVGNTLMVIPFKNHDLVDIEKRTLATSVVNYKGIPDLDLNNFADEANAKNINLRRLILFSSEDGRFRLSSSLNTMLFGSIVPFGSFYIVCGISMWEYILYMSRAVFISVVACAILWLFVHFISLTVSQHKLNGMDLRKQLTAYCLVLTVGIFCMSWYVQVLNNVTNDLNAMQIYADSGVAALKSFQGNQQLFNDWFDEQYLIQCRIARDYVKSKGKENITRNDLAELSENLGIQYIYVYDRNGQVAVTNSPYDHFKLSEDASAPSHAFQPLLEGADHVILQPMPNEISGERIQLIGVSLRNEEDLSDGFVQISVDPALRDYLNQSLGMDSVLTDMTVGMPTDAFVVNKADLTISATTGFGYIGQSIEDFGYNADKLKTTRSGFLKRGDKTYYAGFSESEKYYLVPVAERTSDTASLYISLRIALVALVGQALILLMALFHYQRDVVDAAPSAEEIAEAPEEKEASLSRGAMSFAGIGSIVKAQQKYGFENRWHMQTNKSSQTPGERVRAIGYKLLLIFCVVNLLPVIYGTLSDNTSISGLSYVLTGNWEKGANIFAVTSCLFLLFVLYVFVTLANRVLYNIARVSDLRTETVCLLLRSSLKYVSVIAFIYYGLSKFGIPTQALLASAGIITLAVSVGARAMVEDIIAGFFILLEGNIKVGDFIVVGSWHGIVDEIGLRTTRVSYQQDTKIISNASMRDIINNDKSEARMSTKLAVGVNANLAEIEEVIKAELPTLMADLPYMLGAPTYDGVDKFEEGNMILKFSFTVENLKRYAANREFNRRLKLMFDRHGIDLPVNPAYNFETDLTPQKAE